MGSESLLGAAAQSLRNTHRPSLGHLANIGQDDVNDEIGDQSRALSRGVSANESLASRAPQSSVLPAANEHGRPFWEQVNEW
jgi:hypothetical protein